MKVCIQYISSTSLSIHSAGKILASECIHSSEGIQILRKLIVPKEKKKKKTQK
jgi:hypothetical protein